MVEDSQTINAQKEGNIKPAVLHVHLGNLLHSSLQGFPEDETPVHSKLIIISLLCIHLHLQNTSGSLPAGIVHVSYITWGVYIAFSSLTARGVCS